MKKALLLLPMLLLVGCRLDTWDYAQVEGTVSQVRILQNGETITRDHNHPVAGAVIGHAVIGGAKGAILGAVIGSGQVTATHTEEIAGCEIFITTHVNGQTQDRKFVLTNQYSDLTKKCAMALPGDPALVQYHYLHGDHGTTEDFYTWECAYSGEVYCTKEEVH